MRLKELQSFWQGYVIIQVKGERPEEFINLALQQGVTLWDTEIIDDNRFLAKVAIPQIKLLRPVARISKTRFKIQGKKGLPFVWRRLRQRKTFLAGAFIFILLLYNLSANIWFVDWSSSEELEILNPQEVLQLARTEGLRPGVRKTNLDLGRIENILEVNLPDLAWAGIEIKGTRAIIRLVEKKLPRGSQLDGPGHLIAAKDGVVDEILVITGQPRVQMGDTVTAGQILVSGITVHNFEEDEDFVPGGPGLVRARGVVKGRVWYEGWGEVALVEEGMRLTGQEINSIGINIGAKEIVLKGPHASPFAHYKVKETRHKLVSWRNWQAPVELLKITYSQIEPFQRELGQTEARQVALEKAMLDISGQMPPHSQIVDRREEWDDSSAEFLRLKIIIETVEDIGEFHPLT